MYFNLIYLIVCAAPEAPSPPEILPAPGSAEIVATEGVSVDSEFIEPQRVEAPSNRVNYNYFAKPDYSITPHAPPTASQPVRGEVFEEAFADAHFPMAHGSCGCPICEAKWTKRRAKRGISTGDMYPHMPYYPVNHGYFYFRPYNYSHIAQHQAIAQRWGADPRTPYQTPIFDVLNAEREARRLAEMPAEIPQPEFVEEVEKRPSDFFVPVRKN